MESDTAAPSPSPERGHLPRTGENTPSIQSGEQGHGRSMERPALAETRESLPAPTGAAASSFVAPPLPALPPAQQSQPSTPSGVVSIDDNPIAAADEDLIEKEWVDRAKKIISTTKDDPYAQEREISKLQADYLKKRYGKEIKISAE